MKEFRDLHSGGHWRHFEGGNSVICIVVNPSELEPFWLSFSMPQVARKSLCDFAFNYMQFITKEIRVICRPSDTSLASCLHF